MLTGIEIDFVVLDSIKALDLYEHIFDVQRIEVTDYACGLNEAVFTMYGTRFHMLDENPQYMLTAPTPGNSSSMWLNISVPDIREIYKKAMASGCMEIQPPVDMEAMGITTAIFSDPFGYVWMLSEVHRDVSFEERCRIMEDHISAGDNL